MAAAKAAAGMSLSAPAMAAEVAPPVRPPCSASMAASGGCRQCSGREYPAGSWAWSGSGSGAGAVSRRGPPGIAKCFVNQTTSRLRLAGDFCATNPARPRHHCKQESQGATAAGGTAVGCVMESEARKKTGAELREEYFLAAQTGQERGLPEGAFLNDNVTDGPMVDITFEPYGDTCCAPEGSSLLKAAVEAGALTIDNRFCLTGQCDVCCVELENGEIVRSCMNPVPSGKSTFTVLVVDSDEAWEAMSV